jgi:hypothetical protein
MTHPTAMPHGDRREIEQAADVSVTPAQQIYWAMAHRLDACRGCTGFRIEELGLANLVSASDSGRSRPQGRREARVPHSQALSWRR